MNTPFGIINQHGKLQADWKNDLLEEEGEGYLPESCKRVLELQSIEATSVGSGHGEMLMREFLGSHQASVADVIFLDLNPLMGEGRQSDLGEECIMDKLERFYRRFGFENRHRHARMWLCKSTSIPKKQLPT